MELHANDGMLAVLDRHDFSIVCCGRNDTQRRWKRWTIDHQ
jgi:hypothetical protein